MAEDQELTTREIYEAFIGMMEDQRDMEVEDFIRGRARDRSGELIPVAKGFLEWQLQIEAAKRVLESLDEGTTAAEDMNGDYDTLQF